jgi:TrmH family RNA methyltransferase
VTFDDIRKLHQKKYREAFGHFLVEGEHLVLELQKAALTRPELRDSRLYVTEPYADWPTPFRKTVVTPKQMAAMADTQTPQGILAVAPLLAAAGSSEVDKAVYLYEVQDPGNLGTILRTLGWFGGFRCLLSPGSVDPFNPKVVRASMGAIFHVPLELDVPLDSLSGRFSSIACLDMAGKPLRNTTFASHDCYVFGNEARGVPRDALAAMRAQPYTIAGGGAIESLNLATAVNMCVYELKR